MTHNQQEALERALQPDAGIVRPVGEQSVAIITRLNATVQNPNHVGNILRRTCMAVGEAACQKTCALRGTEEYFKSVDKRCADQNLCEALSSLGIEPEEVLMVAVTGNNVGFGDQLEEYREAGRLQDNPEGWRELPGFNAFFARTSEIPAIGSRLADCAHFEFEFQDSEGSTVIGFEHGTRPNMAGPSAYMFDVNGQPVSYTHYVLHQAVTHYGVNPDSIRIRLSSSIRAENFKKHFDSREKMEAHIPGWQAAGFVQNITNPTWQPGDPVLAEDEWHADARGLILHDAYEAMEALGIPAENFAHDNMLDPADTNGEYSSYEMRGVHGDSRDLYLIAHHSAFDSE